MPRIHAHPQTCWLERGAPATGIAQRLCIGCASEASGVIAALRSLQDVAASGGLPVRNPRYDGHFRAEDPCSWANEPRSRGGNRCLHRHGGSRHIAAPLPRSRNALRSPTEPPEAPEPAVHWPETGYPRLPYPEHRSRSALCSPNAPERPSQRLSGAAHLMLRMKGTCLAVEFNRSRMPVVANRMHH